MGTGVARRQRDILGLETYWKADNIYIYAVPPNRIPLTGSAQTHSLSTFRLDVSFFRRAHEVFPVFSSDKCDSG